MKIGVVGSRSITKFDPVHKAIWDSPWFEAAGYDSPPEWGYMLVSGGADGVDSSAEEFAEAMNIDIEVIELDWDDWSDGNPAKVRNTEIIEESDVVVAIWDGKSPGTRDTIDKALDRGVPIYVEVVDS